MTRNIILSNGELTVGLNGFDFIIQKAFDTSLKVVENLLNIRLVFKQINPGEARVVIN